MANNSPNANSIRELSGAQVAELIQRAGATQLEIAGVVGCSQGLVHHTIYHRGRKVSWRAAEIWEEIEKRLVAAGFSEEIKKRVAAAKVPA